MKSVQHSAKTCAAICMAAALVLLLAGTNARAQSETERRGGNIYVPLSQPLVVNYGGTGRLKYLRADVSLRVENSQKAELVRHHMPLIRSNLVMLFSRQEDQDVNTQTGREQLRQLALDETNALLRAEEGQNDVVQDLLFNNFVVQR